MGGVVTLVTYRSERPHAQTLGGRLARRCCLSIVTMFSFQTGIFLLLMMSLRDVSGRHVQ